MTAQCVFRPGDNVMFVVNNKPYVDFSIPVESNDYRDVEAGTIFIYDPCNKLVIEDTLCPMPDKVGWYFYNFLTTEDSPVGLWRVEIELSVDVPECNTTFCREIAKSDIITPGSTGTTGTSGTGTSGTSGTSGTPELTTTTAVKVDHFRLVSREMTS